MYAVFCLRVLGLVFDFTVLLLFDDAERSRLLLRLY